MLLPTHLTDGTTESQGKLSHLPPVPELENRESGLKAGLGPSPHPTLHPHPIPCPTLHPQPSKWPVRWNNSSQSKLCTSQSCPGLFLTFNAWLHPLTHLHVPSPGSTPARLSSPTSQRLNGAFRRAVGEPPSHSGPLLPASDWSVTAGDQAGWSPPRTIERALPEWRCPFLLPPALGLRREVWE